MQFLLYFKSGGVAIPPAKVVDGTGSVWLSQLQCTGLEVGISQCQQRPLGNNSCPHSKDIGVRCGMYVT